MMSIVFVVLGKHIDCDNAVSGGLLSKDNEYDAGAGDNDDNEGKVSIGIMIGMMMMILVLAMIIMIFIMMNMMITIYIVWPIQRPLEKDCLIMLGN